MACIMTKEKRLNILIKTDPTTWPNSCVSSDAQPREQPPTLRLLHASQRRCMCICILPHIEIPVSVHVVQINAKGRSGLDDPEIHLASSLLALYA